MPDEISIGAEFTAQSALWENRSLPDISGETVARIMVLLGVESV